MKNRSGFQKIFLISILFFLLQSVAMAAGLQETGHMSNGPCFDLIEQNGYLYTGEGSEVRVYDVSTPEKIAGLNWVSGVPGSSIGRLDTTYFVNDLSANGTYLYITTEGRFIIADISGPANPAVLSTIENPYDTYRYPMYAAEIRGNYAYISLQGKGIMVVDISNRRAPAVIRTVALAGNNAPKRLTSSGQYLYVGLDGDKRMDILDLSSPANPVVVGSYAPVINLSTSTFSGVAVKDNVAYVTEYHWGVRAVDVSNPKNPVEIGLLRGAESGDINANDIRIQGNYAYVSTRYQGVLIVDITDPRNMKAVGTGSDLRTAGYVEGIYVTPRYTYIAASTFGIGIYDTSSVTRPVMVAYIPVNSGVDSIASTDKYVYLGAHNLGVWVMDVTDPANPKQVGFANTKGRILGLDVQGNYVYTAGAWMGLTVIDVSQPTSPKIVVQNYGSSISRVLADGNYAYTTVGIADISNPLSPAYVSNPQYFVDSSKFAKLGNNHVVVANSIESKGLYIYDVASKTSPVLDAAYLPGTAFNDVTVDGNIAVALTGNDIVTISLADPAKPVQLGKISYAGSWAGRSITLDTKNPHTVYVAGGINDDIRSFDISDPVNIRSIESISLPGIQESVDYNNGYLYTGGLYSGAYVLSTATLATVNHAPVITEIGNRTVIANRLLQFSIDASDPDGDTLTYSARNLPTNATFNAVTHTFSWVPVTGQAGSGYAPVFTVSDSNLSTERSAAISVVLNQPPVMTSIPPTTTTEGAPLNFTVTATDPESDELSYSAQNLPSGSSFNVTSRQFSWTPAKGQNGTYSVTFQVSDGELSNTTSAKITVNATKPATSSNHSPIIAPIGNKTVPEGTPLNFTVTATDPDNDLLSYSAQNLPSGSSFNVTSRQFSWTPAKGQNGTYSVVFRVTDGSLTNSTSAFIIVSAASGTINRPPVIADFGNTTTVPNKVFSFRVVASDPDGDPLTYTMSMAPSGAVFDKVTRTFSWTPQQAGSYATQFVVSDGKTQVAKAAWITVVATKTVTNSAPVIQDIPAVSTKTGTPVTFIVSASDADRDPLTYAMTISPSGSRFDTSTRNFSWTPQLAGTYTVQFVVSDGKTQVAKSTVITVVSAKTPANSPPVINDIAPVTVTVGDQVRFTVSASDADKDPLTYTMTMTPPGSVFNTSTRTFTWTPQQAGTYAVQFVVSDGKTQVAKSTQIYVKNKVYIMLT